MNWGQMKDAVPYFCLFGVVVISWFLIQEVTGSNKYSNVLGTEFNEFSENI